MKQIESLLIKYNNLPLQLKAGICFLICSFLQKGISVISTPIFTRLLSPAEYGTYNIFNSWLDIITIFVTFDLYAGVYVQGLVKFEYEREKFSSSLQGLVTLLITVSTGIYLLSHNFWNNLFSLTTTQMLFMLILIWTTAIFRFWSAKERVVYSYKYLVILTLCVSIAKPFFGVLFVLYFNDKVTARILGLVLVELVGYSWLFFFQARKASIFNTKYWKYALSFNFPLLSHYLSQIILNSSDRIMINSMIGKSEAGIYSLAYSIAQLMLLFDLALRQTIEPWIYTKIKQNKISDIVPVAYTSFVCIAILDLLLILFVPEIVSIFAPKEYHEAINIIPIVTMGLFFSFSYNFFANFEFYFEKRFFIMIASIVGAILNILLNYFLLPIYGYYVAGYTTLVCYFLFAVGHFIFMSKTIKSKLGITQPYDTRILCIIALLFIALASCLVITYNLPSIRYGCMTVFIICAICFRSNIHTTIKKFIKIKRNK